MHFLRISSKKCLQHFIMKLGLIIKIDYNVTLEVRMCFPLPVIDWMAHSVLLPRYNTGRKRIEWEVWRWISTPGTDESMAALSQTRAAMLWSVTQKYDLSKPPLVTSGPTPFSSSFNSKIEIRPGFNIIINHSETTMVTSLEWWADTNNWIFQRKFHLCITSLKLYSTRLVK